MADVETTRAGAVLTITLNRPDVLNAFTREMHKAFAGALDEAAATDVRAVVLTGAGRGFCVGQDLTEFREASGDIASHLENNYHPNIRAIRGHFSPEEHRGVEVPGIYWHFVDVMWIFVFFSLYIL